MNEDYERIINKLKKLHRFYYGLSFKMSKISDKTIARVKMELIEKILESEHIEVTREYD